MTKCRERRTKLEENVETLRKTHMELMHSKDKCALEIKVWNYYHCGLCIMYYHVLLIIKSLYIRSDAVVWIY